MACAGWFKPGTADASFEASDARVCCTAAGVGDAGMAAAVSGAGRGGRPPARLETGAGTALASWAWEAASVDRLSRADQ